MYRLLHSLDMELSRQRKKHVHERSTDGIVRLLHCMHELSESNSMDAISDFTYQVSSCLLELERLKVHLDQRALAYIFVAKLIIQESFGNYISGKQPHANARSEALIGSMCRRVDEESSGRNSRWERSASRMPGSVRPPGSPVY
jgi:chemotaxis protein histidine kinase CheA